MEALRSGLISLAGLFGALGVAGAAYAAHGSLDPRRIAIAAAIALVHAPALLALGAAVPERLRFGLLTGGLIALGVALFSGDLAMRAFTGAPLFSNAAPAGGLFLIAGWLVLAAGGIVRLFAASGR